MPQGWFLMAEEDKRKRGGRGGLDVVLSHRPPLWPRRSDLTTKRLTNSFWGSRVENNMQTASSHGVASTQWPVTKIATWLRGWGMWEEASAAYYSPSLRPVNQGTTSQTRRGGRRGRWEGWERRQTVAKRPWVILRPLRFDPDWGGQRGDRQTTKQKKKSSSSTCPETRVLTDLFCSIKLQRTRCHIPPQKSWPHETGGSDGTAGGRGGQRLSLVIVKQGLHSHVSLHSEVIYPFTKTIVTVWKKEKLQSQGNDVLWPC